ncbi:holocytochrome c synthase [Tieghemiomyces parasiticus]|uniref:Holocytochrome c-type synthase n=1 Tax=Tieghemiomyces parasiticus TaxID=78921 RepID=A0A9W8E0A4_9FUNG|nr:holocytochrome c synthase [Tieghemiomyces parasiticus]
MSSTDKPAPVKSCPVDHGAATTSSDASTRNWSNLFGLIPSGPAAQSTAAPATPPPSSSSPATSTSSDKVHAHNLMPTLEQTPVPGQHLVLSTEREVSTIPRAFVGECADGSCPVGSNSAAAECPVATNDGKTASVSHADTNGLFTHDGVDDPAQSTNWVYPSSQQFHQALVRKGWETPEGEVDTMVAIHNFLNEGCWQEVLKWEKLHADECREPKLLRLRGRPNDLSPKARLLGWFGTPRPFDRHDWTVSRCGKEVRYIIDYYSGDGNADMPEFYVDVRPALDSPQNVYDRARVALKEGYERLAGDQKPMTK